MNLIIITPFEGTRYQRGKSYLRQMVLCQKCAVENRHLVADTRGMTDDECFICNKDWFVKFRERLAKQAWLDEIGMHDAVYISGPMSGLPDNNKPAFHLMEHILSQMACTVLSPARYKDRTEELLDYPEQMRRDIRMVCAANKVVVLDQYTGSKGVEVELAVAKAIGLTIFYEQV